MKQTDLSDFNLAELKGLLHDIDREMKSRKLREVRAAREQILAIAQRAGVSAEELLSTEVKTPNGRTGQKVPVQFRNPGDQTQTWSGRGRKPRWVIDALANGSAIDELRVQAA